MKGWTGVQEGSSRRKRLKKEVRKAWASWRKSGSTGLQLFPGSALLELAYLAGKDQVVDKREALVLKVSIAGRYHVV